MISIVLVFVLSVWATILLRSFGGKPNQPQQFDELLTGMTCGGRAGSWTFIGNLSGLDDYCLVCNYQALIIVEWRGTKQTRDSTIEHGSLLNLAHWWGHLLLEKKLCASRLWEHVLAQQHEQTRRGCVINIGGSRRPFGGVEFFKVFHVFGDIDAKMARTSSKVFYRAIVYSDQGMWCKCCDLRKVWKVIVLGPKENTVFDTSGDGHVGNIWVMKWPEPVLLGYPKYSIHPKVHWKEGRRGATFEKASDTAAPRQGHPFKGNRWALGGLRLPQKWMITMHYCLWVGKLGHRSCNCCFF